MIKIGVTDYDKLHLCIVVNFSVGDGRLVTDRWLCGCHVKFHIEVIWMLCYTHIYKQFNLFCFRSFFASLPGPAVPNLHICILFHLTINTGTEVEFWVSFLTSIFKIKNISSIL